MQVFESVFNPLPSVPTVVITDIHNFKVFNTIVFLVAIFVMNMQMAGQFATKVFLHDDAMFVHSFAINKFWVHDVLVFWLVLSQAFLMILVAFTRAVCRFRPPLWPSVSFSTKTAVKFIVIRPYSSFWNRVFCRAFNRAVHSSIFFAVWSSAEFFSARFAASFDSWEKVKQLWIRFSLVVTRSRAKSLRSIFFKRITAFFTTGIHAGLISESCNIVNAYWPGPDFRR